MSFAGRFWLGGVVVVSSLALVGWAAQRADEATGPAVITLTDVQVSARAIAAGSGGVGTTTIVGLKLFGSGQRSRPIGRAVLTCLTVTGREQSCSATYVLPQGMIVTAGLVSSRLFYTAAITGGTGLYDNARGTLTVTAKVIKPRRELLLFRLSG